MVKNKIDSLTSLRFFAAGGIVLGHGAATTAWNYYIPLLDVRNCVSFFFVLSGFILTYTYREKIKDVGIRGFLVARLARIWPVHFFTALVAIGLAVPGTLDTTPLSILKIASNFFLIHANIPLNDWYYSLNGVSWSISAEMVFYIAFPFLLAPVISRPIMSMCLALIWALILAITMQFSGIGSSEVDRFSEWGFFYVSPIPRITEFVFGMSACALWDYERRFTTIRGFAFWSAAEVLILLALFSAFGFTRWIGTDLLKDGPFHVWILTWGCFPIVAGAIGILALQRGVVSKALSASWLVYLGEISFSLYMVHQMVMRFMRDHLQSFVHGYWALSYATYWIVSLGLAALLYQFVEGPSRRLILKLWKTRSDSRMTRQQYTA